MCSTFSTTTTSSCSSFIPQNPFFNFPNHRKCRTKKLPIKSSTKPSLNPLNVPSTQTPPIIHLLKCSKTSIKFPVVKQNEEKKNPFFYNDENALKFTVLAKPLVYTLFCLALGSCPIFGFVCKPAVAVAAVASEVVNREREGEEREKKGHEYSHYTESLLKTVLGLVRAIEEARRGKSNVKVVKERLKEVILRKKELQDEIMNGLYAELRVLKGEKEGLVQRSEELLDVVLKAKREEEGLLRKVKESAEEVKGKIAKLEEVVRDGEREYNEIWEKISEIEDQITRRETLALSIGVRELSFIERECEQLVEGFLREMRRQPIER